MNYIDNKFAPDFHSNALQSPELPAKEFAQRCSRPPADAPPGEIKDILSQFIVYLESYPKTRQHAGHGLPARARDGKPADAADRCLQGVFVSAVEI
ncbi:MAG: hypothetical protein K2O10_00465 [Muribaculaceae bacterium]|nr:hypothetical protein [Muribaculaceae bacterium]